MDSLSPLQKIHHPLFAAKDVNLWVKRDDLIQSPFVGNKHRKIIPHIQAAQKLGVKTIISCGGAFSNHLHALSYIPELFGLEVIAFVRGELNDPNNPNFIHLKSKKVKLIEVPRSEYVDVTVKMKEIADQVGDAYIIPEGGTDTRGTSGMQSCYQEIISELGGEPEYIVCPVGSGGTLAGLINSAQKSKVIGIASVKGEEAVDALRSKVKKLCLASLVDWKLIFDDRFGRFGSMNPYLFDMSIKILSEWEIKPDPIYTARSFTLVSDLIVQNYFLKGANIVCLHTGGLQGWNGMQYRYKGKYNFSRFL